MCKIKNSKSSEKHTNTIHLIIMHEISGVAWEGRRKILGVRGGGGGSEMFFHFVFF